MLSEYSLPNSQYVNWYHLFFHKPELLMFFSILVYESFEHHRDQKLWEVFRKILVRCFPWSFAACRMVRNWHHEVSKDRKKIGIKLESEWMSVSARQKKIM